MPAARASRRRSRDDVRKRFLKALFAENVQIIFRMLGFPYRARTARQTCSSGP